MRVRVLQVPALTLASRLCNIYLASVILAIAPNTNSWKQRASAFLGGNRPVPPSLVLTLAAYPPCRT